MMEIEQQQERGKSGRLVLGESIKVRMRASDRAELQKVAQGADLAEGALIRRILVRWLADRSRLAEGGGVQ